MASICRQYSLCHICSAGAAWKQPWRVCGPVQLHSGATSCAETGCGPHLALGHSLSTPLSRLGGNHLDAPYPDLKLNCGSVSTSDMTWNKINYLKTSILVLPLLQIKFQGRTKEKGIAGFGPEPWSNCGQCRGRKGLARPHCVQVWDAVTLQRQVHRRHNAVLV